MDHGISILDAMLIEMDLGAPISSVSGGGSISITTQNIPNQGTKTPSGKVGERLVDKPLDKEDEKIKNRKLIKRH